MKIEITATFLNRQITTPLDIPHHDRSWRIPFIIRFLSKIEFTETCWIWKGLQQGTGYGLISRGGKKVQFVTAHRGSFEYFNGPIPPDIFVCHKCDNRLCVNPEHLFLGTLQDNHRDAQAKGRLRGPAKLTEDQVRKIRSLYATGNYSIPDLCKIFKFSNGGIYGIVRFKKWTWVTPTPEEQSSATMRICKQISNDKRQQIQKLYNAGKRPVDIAKQFGITPTRVIQMGKHGY